VQITPSITPHKRAELVLLTAAERMRCPSSHEAQEAKAPREVLRFCNALFNPTPASNRLSDAEVAF